MNFKLAYSANAYMRFDVFETLERIAALGYRGVELMADAPHLWPDETTSQTAERVRDRLAALNLTVSNVNAFMMNKIGDSRQPYWHPSWIEPDVAYRRIRVEHTRAALTLARQLGAPHITTEPGGPIEAASRPAGNREQLPSRTYAAAMDLFLEELSPVIAHAEREGVQLLIEPEPGLLIERFDQYVELTDRLDSPFVGLNFDIGHAYCVGEEPAEWIPRMASHTRHYHVEDIAATRVHHHLVPGTGAIDIAAALRAIGDTGYDGWLTVELYPFIDDPDAAGRAAKQYLESVAGRINEEETARNGPHASPGPPSRRKAESTDVLMDRRSPNRNKGT